MPQLSRQAMPAGISGTGKSIRFRRLFGHDDGRLFILPMDHSVTSGPLGPVERVNALVRDAAANGVDAVVLHKGRLRAVEHQWFWQLALIVHLSASTVHAPDADAKYPVASVEEALRLGADAVSVHVNLGSDEEARQIADLASTAAASDRWNVPLLAMIYPRGPRIENPFAPEVIAHAAALGADLGADLVKTNYPGHPDSMADIVRSCPIPILAAGGPRLPAAETLECVRGVMASGACGVAVGRSIFEAEQPAVMIRAIRDAVHGADRRPAREQLLTTAQI
jgi:2-amino-4,5-dihydroxy-6-oxo-7-(phosphooxy)heptanoate synthase